VAAAVDLLVRKPGVNRRVVAVAGQTVEWIGPEGSGPPAASGEGRGSSDATAYVFDDLGDREILRRLNQMPDETPMDLLRLPFAIYCRDVRSLVSINQPAASLEEHLRKLARGA
jgi:hypothetical protein